MRVEFTGPALDDFVAITDYIAAHSPQAAERIKARIFAATDRLADQPALGRPGRVGRTRELVLRPYIVAYHVRGQVVEVLAVLDARRGSIEELLAERLTDAEGGG